MRNLTMSRNATCRKQRANILCMKRIVQTCFVIAFGIWVVNQLKLFIGNGNVKTDMSAEFFMVTSNSMPDQQLKLTRKTLRISTELDDAKSIQGGVKEETERNEELTENWIDDFDNQIVEKADSMNDTSNEVHGENNSENGWESSLVTGSNNIESLDSSVSEFDQYEKEDNLDVEVLGKKTRIEEANEEDSAGE
ncbi:hypothetical protein KSS87_022372 [Heliosperma pusillum]|nr:hypothetical protein KSS87_022372 [Heliosperma pusillum]